MSNIMYEIVGYDADGQSKIKFTNTPFDDIIFRLGKVSFEEVDDQAVMHYDYVVLEHTEEHPKEELDKFIGDFLVQLITDGVKDNNLIYTGGVDENRD